jgi:hypothetical protein
VTGDAHVFRLSVPEGFEWVVPTDPADFEVVRMLAERPVGSGWEPIHMTLLKVDDHGLPHQGAYLPWLGSEAIVLRDEAIETVGALLRPHGELLPLLCDDARLTLFAAPAVAGVLDENRSDLDRFGSGRVMALRAPVFRADVLGSTGAFKLAEMPRGDLFLTGDLVEAIRATGMTAGTDFAPVYLGGARQ